MFFSGDDRHVVIEVVPVPGVDRDVIFIVADVLPSVAEVLYPVHNFGVEPPFLAPGGIPVPVFPHRDKYSGDELG